VSLSEASGLGFYGKLPVLGDFVSRRLDPDFIKPWQQWLEACLHSSQQTMAEAWLPAFLVSPIWRFALSPGLCGPSAWVGIMMPCVDKVGRYFPLTLAQSIEANDMPAVFLADADWFDQLEYLALSALSADFEFDRFERSVKLLELKNHVPQRWFNKDISQVNNAAAYPQGWYGPENQNPLEYLFPRLSQSLMGKLFTNYSFWATKESPLLPAQFTYCEGLPTADRFVGFLTGGFQVAKAEHIIQDATMHVDSQQDLVDRVETADASAAQSMLEHAWVSHGISVVGNVRKQNEDAMLNNPVAGVWVVADGMGGHQSGDVASRAIVEAFAELKKCADISVLMEQASAKLQQLNSELSYYASSFNHTCVVGSTVVVLLAYGSHCGVIWAGDSRLYRFRLGQLSQLTRDHTLVDELIEVNGLSREQALLQAGANVITRAVGGDEELVLDSYLFDAEIGDRYLLCSDGLDKELSDSEITALMTLGDSHTVAENLIKQALKKYGRDNITVVIADFYAG
jgi:type VI secretion system protein ImpM